MSLQGRWAVLYDADCGFCMWVLSLLLRWDREQRLRPIALQGAEAESLLRELAPAERMASWHLVSPRGERRSGGGALPPLLRLLRFGRAPAAALERVPRATDWAYRWVAGHRSQLSRLVPSKARRRGSERVRAREQLTS